MYTTICQQLQSLDIIPYRRTPGYALHLVPAARSLTLTLTMPSAARLGQVLADGCPPHPDAVRVGGGHICRVWGHAPRPGLRPLYSLLLQ